MMQHVDRHAGDDRGIRGRHAQDEDAIAGVATEALALVEAVDHDAADQHHHHRRHRHGDDDPEYPEQLGHDEHRHHAHHRWNLDALRSDQRQHEVSFNDVDDDAEEDHQQEMTAGPYAGKPVAAQHEQGRKQRTDEGSEERHNDDRAN